MKNETQAKRRHDVQAALRVLQYAVEDIKEGYRFDDADAEKKIAAMEKALTVILSAAKDLPDLLEIKV